MKILGVYAWVPMIEVPEKYRYHAEISGDELLELSLSFDVAILHTLDGKPYISLDQLGKRFSIR